MSVTAEYTPPQVWTFEAPSGGRFANINRPVSGATHEKELPVGRHPFQLYSLATPNGVKVTIMLEELLEAGHSGAEYDAWLIRIGEGDQFGSGFVAINPNSKIPALLDRSGAKPIRVFESGAILLYLAEKFGAFLARNMIPRPLDTGHAVAAAGVRSLGTALAVDRLECRNPERDENLHAHILSRRNQVLPRRFRTQMRHSIQGRMTQ